MKDKKKLTPAEKKAERELALAKAFGHPLRVKIFAALGDAGGISPNMLSGLLKEPLGNVSYHVKILLELECVELIRTEPRRGAVEHFYARRPDVVAPAEEAGALDRICEAFRVANYEAIDEILRATGRNPGSWA